MSNPQHPSKTNTFAPNTQSPHPNACTEERMAALLAAIQGIPTSPELSDGLADVADHLQGLIRYDNLAVLLLDDRGRELRFAYARGYAPEVAEHWRFGLGQGLVGTAARERRTLFVEDVCSDDRYMAAAPGTRSELVLPLFARGRIIGVLDLGSLERQEIDESRIRLLERLADGIALSIESRRMQDGLREQTRLMSLLHQIGRELSSILDRRQVLERMADRLRNLIDHDIFSVLLWNESTQLLEPWVNVFFDRRPAESRAMRLGEGITGSAAALRQALRVPNVALDPRHVECDPELETRSEMAVPLVFEDRLIGVLDLSSTHYDAFSAAHEQLVSTLGSSLAIALANAEMYERLDQEQQRMDRDLRAARQVQKRLLPQSTPWISGMQIGVDSETAAHLGGDFYDFLRYDDGRIAIAVGDVAGKSTSAALYGALAVGHLREIASYHEPSPRVMLQLLNQKLRDLEMERIFVALTYLTFDPKSRVLTLANAGLPYPILLRDGKPIEIENGGIPVGSLADPDYSEVDLKLEHGDSLVLLSDGVPEGRNGQGEEFGHERTELSLRRLAGECADSVASGLLSDLSRFAGEEVSDDRTVVVVRACDGDCD